MTGSVLRSRRTLITVAAVLIVVSAICSITMRSRGYSSPIHKPTDGFGLTGDVLGESLGEFTTRHSHYEFHFRQVGEAVENGKRPAWFQVQHFPLCRPSAEKNVVSCFISFRASTMISGIPIESAEFFFTGDRLSQINAYIQAADALDFRSYLATQYGPPSGVDIQRGEDVYGKEMEVIGAWSGAGHLCVGRLKYLPRFAYVIADEGTLHTAAEWRSYFSGMIDRFQQ